jgi:hypothetical protein
MLCCCKKTYRYCPTVSVCEPVELNRLFAGLANGTYRFTYNFINAVNNVTIVKTDAEVTIEDGLTLNENFTYTGQLYNSSDVLVPLTVDGVAYDCVQFNTMP